MLTAFDAPLMQSIVPLIFLLFFMPAAVYGYIAGTVESHRDIVAGMTKTMSTMGYYLAMVFFAAQFTAPSRRSNLGALLSVEGRRSAASGSALPGGGHHRRHHPARRSLVDLLIGSASAKWAVLAPIFVPMLMQVGLSPELTQAAYRVGDSVVNIITPLMPYFPLVVAFSQRWVKRAGIGTLVSLMLPYSRHLRRVLDALPARSTGRSASRSGSRLHLHLPLKPAANAARPRMVYTDQLATADGRGRDSAAEAVMKARHTADHEPCDGRRAGRRGRRAGPRPPTWCGSRTARASKAT